MKRVAWVALNVAVYAFAACMGCAVGCAYAADRYRAEQIACVERYKPDQAQIDACRANARAAAGLPPRGFDAGR